MKKIVQILLLLLFSETVVSGGSHTNVELLQFTTYGEEKYILVVKPVNDHKYKDPYTDKCNIFTVMGSYKSLGLFEFGSLPSKEDYYTAVSYLNTHPKVLKLGWMGGGFKILNNEEPCLVASRALELIKGEYGIAIYSYFDPT